MTKLDNTSKQYFGYEETLNHFGNNELLAFY